MNNIAFPVILINGTEIYLKNRIEIYREPDNSCDNIYARCNETKKITCIGDSNRIPVKKSTGEEYIVPYEFVYDGETVRLKSNYGLEPVKVGSKEFANGSIPLRSKSEGKIGPFEFSVQT